MHQSLAMCGKSELSIQAGSVLVKARMLMFSTVNLVSLSNEPLLFPMLQQVWICLTLVLLKLAEKIFSHSLSICTYTPSRLCQNIGIQRSAYVKSIYNSILFPQANSAAIQSFSLYNLVQSCHFLIFFFFF